MKFPWPAVFIITAIAMLRIAEVKSDELVKALPAADAMHGKDAGQVRDDNGLKLKLVWCPPAKYTMGSPISEKDRKSREDEAVVKLTTGFWLGKFEVTQSQWEELMATTPWKSKPFVKEGADYPATYITWNQAVEFCQQMTRHEQNSGRLPRDWEFTLPTEAEWEYACRAGTTTAFSFGDDDSSIAEYAWCYGANRRDEEYSHRVGQKKANAWGFHDMHGNVWEWCQDWYEEKAPGGMDPTGPAKGALKVHRSGSWRFPESLCRSAYRWGVPPTYENTDMDFRLACRLAAKK